MYVCPILLFLKFFSVLVYMDDCSCATIILAPRFFVFKVKFCLTLFQLKSITVLYHAECQWYRNEFYMPYHCLRDYTYNDV